MLTAQPLIAKQQLFPLDLLKPLQQYANFFKADPQRADQSFRRDGFYYSRSIVSVVGSSVEEMLKELSGAAMGTSGTSRTFGYLYAQSGVVIRNSEMRLSRQTPPRESVFMFDSALHEKIKLESLVLILRTFRDMAELSNHDLLHGVCGYPEKFKAFDKHLRYGGVEFAPILAHAAFMDSEFRRDRSLLEKISATTQTYVHLVKTACRTTLDADSFEKEKLYFCSIYLRQLLLLFPHNHPQVQIFLEHVDRDLFNQQTIHISGSKFETFLERDFSQGAHADTIKKDAPVHINRTTLYLHGRDSMLGPWLKQFFAQHFTTGFQVPTKLSYSNYLLLDTFSRGHGIYSIISAHTASPQRASLDQILQIFRSAMS